MKQVYSLTQTHLASSTGPTGIKKDECEIIIWDNFTMEPHLIFRPILSHIGTISVSPTEEHLLITGLDTQGRDLILIYDYQSLILHKKLETLARRLSDT